MSGLSLDEYGRLTELGVTPGDRLVVVGAPAAGPIVPPMPAQTHRSPRWPAFLKAFLAAHRKCEGCGRRAETGHHVKPFAKFPDLELVPDNVAAVCVPCHFAVAHCGSWTTYDPDARASLAAHRLRVRAAERL